MIHAPVVNQGSQYLQTKISVSVIHSDKITQSSAPAPQSTARTKAQEQGTSKSDSVYHRRAQNGKGTRCKDINNLNDKVIPTKISIKSEPDSNQTEKDHVEQLSSSKERHSGINHSSNGHNVNVAGDEHQNSQASKLI